MSVSTSGRITQSSMSRTALAGINGSLARMQETQEQLTSGKRLRKPSDSPIDTVSAMRMRGVQRDLSQLGENIKDGQNRLNIADNTLTRATDMLQKAREIAVRGATGTNSPADRAAMAKEVEQVKNGLIQLANTQYGGRPIFAGTADVANAFDPTTGAFLGNNKPVLRQITDSPGASGQMDVAVAGVDGSGGGPFGTLFKASDQVSDGTIDKLVTALQTGGNVGAVLGDLDQALDSLTAAGATVGAKFNRLQNLEMLNGRQDDETVIALSAVEDTDFVKAAMDLQLQSNSYEAALAASAKIIQPSLMDFLR